MKGLLLKDFYVMKKACRAYLLICVVFFGAALIRYERMSFFLIYPCLMAGLIPVTLLAYDERSRFTAYAGALPVTRAQLVSGKYIVGLILQAVSLLLIAAASMIGHAGQGALFMDTVWPIAIGYTFSALLPAVSLPIMFRFGTEKGRAVYMIIGGAGGVACALMAELFTTPAAILPVPHLPAVLCAVSLGAYLISWRASQAIYSRRES